MMSDLQHSNDTAVLFILYSNEPIIIADAKEQLVNPDSIRFSPNEDALFFLKKSCDFHVAHLEMLRDPI
jgi:hypothetical protein